MAVRSRDSSRRFRCRLVLFTPRLRPASSVVSQSISYTLPIVITFIAQFRYVLRNNIDQSVTSYLRIYQPLNNP